MKDHETYQNCKLDLFLGGGIFINSIVKFYSKNFIHKVHNNFINNCN